MLKEVKWKKPICSLVVWQRILLYLLPDSSGASRLWLGRLDVLDGEKVRLTTDITVRHRSQASAITFFFPSSPKFMAKLWVCSAHVFYYLALKLRGETLILFFDTFSSPAWGSFPRPFLSIAQIFSLCTSGCFFHLSLFFFFFFFFLLNFAIWLWKTKPRWSRPAA